MSGRGRYYGGPSTYSRLDDDPSTWSADVGTNDYHETESHTAFQQHESLDHDDYYTQRPTSPPQISTEYEPYRQQHLEAGPTATPQEMPRSSYQPPAYDDFDAIKQRHLGPRPRPPWYLTWREWNRKRQYIIFGSIAGIIILLIIIIAVAASVASSSYSYTPSFAHVTNETAFESGGATNNNPYQNTNDGIGAGADKYTYYTGPASNFPTPDGWVSFDNMWNANLPNIQKSCGYLDEGKDNSNQDNQYIYDAIQNRAQVSLVDHRFILAVILQESHGCVRVGDTTSSSGVTNPGLMQSHNGHKFSASHANESIVAMVQDGTQGTTAGAGLVQNLNTYGNPFSAARGYNSGYIAKSGDLSDAAGATACYVTDIANRLTGWVDAKSTCPGDS